MFIGQYITDFNWRKLLLLRFIQYQQQEGLWTQVRSEMCETSEISETSDSSDVVIVVMIVISSDCCDNVFVLDCPKKMPISCGS